MVQSRDKFFVVTGGPGAGKSTLIEALASRGFARSLEAGRAIIQHQAAIDGPALPWADRAAFAELMLAWELRSWHAADAEVVTIFDRGVPDVAGYLRLCRLPVPAHVHRAAAGFRYNPLVFVAPPWPEIFAQDAERKQGFAEAEATCAAMVETYTALGYACLPLPLASVAERMSFVETHVRRALSSTTGPL